jgi:hypothetical protein
MSSNRRKSARRALSYSAKIVAKDGSWGRNCRVVDVSDGGAKLMTEKPIELPRNFVLALSMYGKALRHCRVVRSQGCEIGVAFEQPVAEPEKVAT